MTLWIVAVVVFGLASHFAHDVQARGTAAWLPSELEFMKRTRCGACLAGGRRND